MHVAAAQFAGLIGDEAGQGALRVEFIDVDRGVTDAVFKRAKVTCQLQGARGTHCVADEALGVVEVSALAAIEHFAERSALLLVAQMRASGMRTDDVNLLGCHTRSPQGQFHALGLSIGVGEHEVGPVDYVLNNSFGMLGINSAVVIKRV